MTLHAHPTDRREEIHVQRLGRLEQSEKIVVDKVAERRATLYRIVQFVWLACGALEALLGLRLVLKFMAANPNAAFAQIIYGFSDLFLLPFANLTVNPAFDGMVLEVSSMIAMVVYALGALMLVQGIWILFYRTRVRSQTTYRRMD